MSDAIVNVGDVTTGQLPAGEHKNDETNLSSVNSQRSQRSAVEIQGVTRYLNAVKGLVPFEFSIGVLLSGFMFGNPLLYYILEMSDEKKCIVVHRLTAYYSCVVITIYDILHVVFYRRRLFKLCNNLQRDAGNMCCLFINILILLPVPQVMVILYIISERMSVWTIWIAQIVLILQRTPRFFQLMVTWRTKEGSRETFLPWSFMFIMLYMIAGQLYGGLWYNGAINAETECWKEACGNHTGCSTDIFSCNKSLEHIKLLNDSCSRNTTKYDFGIFLDAHSSGVLLEGTDMWKRMLFCVNWGLQSISSFGQNIGAVSSILGIIFAIAIIFTGVGLFFFLVGKLQLCLQADTEGSAKMRQKLRETEEWMPFKRLHKNLQHQVINYHYENDLSQKPKDVSIENVFNGLPNNLQRKLNQELCVDLLKKVTQFGNLSEAEMQDLCYCVKPVFFGQRTRIIREGDPIDEMILVVQGKLWTYNGRNHRNEHLKDGDCWGEELVDWFNADPCTSGIPISTETIQAVTDVDAFVLMAHDLKDMRQRFRSRRNAQTNSTQEANSSNTTQSQQ